MSAIFFARVGVEICVNQPGHGELDLIAPDALTEVHPLVEQTWRRNLHGAEIAEFLGKLTERALTADPLLSGRDRQNPLLPGADPAGPRAQLSATLTDPPFSIDLPPFMRPPVARALLPVFQRAMVLAIAGTDRFERTFPDSDGPPKPPLCVRCDEGTIYTTGAPPNPWCDKYGHTPYGVAHGTSWAAATTHYERRLRWFEDDQERERRAGTVDLAQERRNRRGDGEV